MFRQGIHSKIFTFVQHSAGISEQTHAALDHERKQEDDEVLQRVSIAVLPLQSIHAYNEKLNMFEFMSDKLPRLQGSLFIDAVFDGFWEEQKTVIFRFAFLPFLLFFIVANIYYTQCLFPDESIELSVWYQLCMVFGGDEDSCDVQS